MTNESEIPIWRKLLAAEEIGVVVALLAIGAALALSTEGFLRSGNLLQVARQASSYGIMSVGMVLLLSMGEIDLSVGSMLTLVNIVTAIALRENVPVVGAVLIGVAVGAGCGLLNGLLCVLLKMPSIIVTLGTMSVYRGLALVSCQAKAISNFSKDNWLFNLGSDNILGVPTSVHVMFAVGVAGYVLLNHTAFGWRAQAIGSNAQAARYSGIPIAKYRVIAMTIMGLVVSIAGVFELGFSQSGDPSTGLQYELYVIAAAIIGGTSLSGGSGSILGGILGALIITVIRNGLVMLHMSAYWGTVATGAIIILAVAIGNLVKRK